MANSLMSPPCGIFASLAASTGGPGRPAGPPHGLGPGPGESYSDVILAPAAGG